MDNVLSSQMQRQAFEALSCCGSFYCPHISAAAELGGGGGVLDGCTGLPALQPLPCPSRFCMGREGHGCLLHQYTWSVGCCATWFACVFVFLYYFIGSFLSYYGNILLHQ